VKKRRLEIRRVKKKVPTPKKNPEEERKRRTYI